MHAPGQQFGSLTASELYCPKCRRAQPVRERLLLILPTGELFEYLCVGCGASLGQRTVTGPPLSAALAASRSARPARRPLRPPSAPAPKPRLLLK